MDELAEKPYCGDEEEEEDEEDEEKKQDEDTKCILLSMDE